MPVLILLALLIGLFTKGFSSEKQTAKKIKQSTGKTKKEATASGQEEQEETEEKHPWYLLIFICLIDYYSSYAYTFGVALSELSVLAPFGTLGLVVVTALIWCVYLVIVAKSPDGLGAVKLFEDHVHGWLAKLSVLLVLGMFVYMACTFTGSLSTSDAIAHLANDPLIGSFVKMVPRWISASLIVWLGVALYYKGVEKAIVVCVLVAGFYVLYNIVNTVFTYWDISLHPQYVSIWLSTINGNPTFILGKVVEKVPSLALGMSGYETSSALMPMILVTVTSGYVLTHQQELKMRIHNGRILLTVAAGGMCLLLLTGSFGYTIELIGRHASISEGADRIPVYIGQMVLNDLFGQNVGAIYASVGNLSVAVILMFAGVSSIALFVQLIPKYLPRDGGPTWLKKKSVLMMAIGISTTLVIFAYQANTLNQGPGYAYAVVGLLSFGSFVVALDAVVAFWKAAKTALLFWKMLLFIGILTVMGYVFWKNVEAAPVGFLIGLLMFAVLLGVTVVSRVQRSSKELRCGKITMDSTADEAIRFAIDFQYKAKKKNGVQKLIQVKVGPFVLQLGVAKSHPEGYPSISLNMADGRNDKGEIMTERDLVMRYKRVSAAHKIPEEKFSKLFFVVDDVVSHEFESPEVVITGHKYGESYVIRCSGGTSVPNVIVCVLQYIRNHYGVRIDANFNFSRDPRWQEVRYFFYGDGDILQKVRKIAQEQAKVLPPERKPPIVVHVSDDLHI